MRLEPTDEQTFLREAVAGVVARDAPFTTLRTWTEADDHATAAALSMRQGWTGIGLDDELGGQGGGVVELAVLAEELGRGVVPWDRTLAGCLAASLLGSAGSDSALALAGAIAAGQASAAMCLDGRRVPVPWTEPEVASHGHINVAAHYVLGATATQSLVVPVQRGDDVLLYGVSVDAPGVTRTRRRLVDRTRDLADITIIDAPAQELGTVTRSMFQTVADTAAVLIAADALGAAERMLEMTTSYVAQRRQFGVAVGSFQAVKHAAAEMLVDIEASRSAVHYAAWAVDAGTADAGLHAAIAKAYACAAAVRVADKALFLHGAIAYTWEHDLQFPFKRVKSDLEAFGTPDAHRDLIADALELISQASVVPAG